MPNWDTILNTIASEFSDLSDIEMGTRITMRLLLAALLGGMLGFERASQGKAANVIPSFGDKKPPQQ